MTSSSTAPDPWPSAWEAFEDRVLELVNAARATGHELVGAPTAALARLVSEPHLRVAARRHSLDMAATGRFDHAGSDGRGAWDRIEAAGYGQLSWQGENIAAGHATPESVVAGWMSSPGHRANILSGNFREVGVGYAFSSGSPAGHYWTLVLATR